MNTVIYAKYSNDRNRRFSIRTEILEDEAGNRLVRKLPAHPEAKAHVLAMCDRYRLLSAQTEGTRLSFNRCKKAEEGVEFEYLEGPSLESQLLGTLQHQGIDACVQDLTDCLQFIRDLHTGSTFTVTDSFREVFGDAAPAPGTDCAPCTDIDLLCENLILSDGKWVAIDYEWSFDFPVPVNYLLYRIILHFTDHANRGEEFRPFDLMGRLGISSEEQEIFAAMEEHFQQYILGEHVPVCSLYPDISSGYVKTEDYFPEEMLQVYFDLGNDFNEKDSVCYPMFHTAYWKADRLIDLPEGTRRLRVDPGSHAAMVHLTALCFDNQKQQAGVVLLEGTALDDWLYFNHADPGFFLTEIPEGTKQLHVELEVYETLPETLTPVLRQSEELSRQSAKIAELEETTRNKIWRKLHEHS